MPPPPPPSLLTPSDDDEQDVLLSCRFGDIDDIEHFVATFSPDALTTARDDNDNSVLHMAAGNGHADVLAYLLPRVDPTLLGHRNRAGSTPLHWAAVNRHLDAARALVTFPAGAGADLIDIKNDAGRTPLGEAELAGWDEGARWFVQVMHLDSARVEEQDVDTQGEESQSPPADSSQAIEVEIQDADGRVAKIAINPKTPVPDQTLS